MKRLLLLLVSMLSLFVATAAFSQNFSISGDVDWEKLELNVVMGLDLSSARLRLPSGRLQAEELLREQYPRRVRPFLFNLPVDSNTKLEDWTNRSTYTLKQLDALTLSSREIPSNLSADFSTMNARYLLDLFPLSSDLIKHNRAEDLRRVIGPASAAAYTGLIIIADELLPAYGRNSSTQVQPCFLPRIWDSAMELVYELNTIDPARSLRPYERDTRNPTGPLVINEDKDLPQNRFLKDAVVRYTGRASVFAPTPSGLTPEIERIVGSNPLRILAQSVYGERPTDPVINADDALALFVNPENHRILREGRVVIVIDQDLLRGNTRTIPLWWRKVMENYNLLMKR
ncbi:polymerase [Breznakiellaceae bacterium SP9]